jgi:hypothetical protein
MRVIWQFPLELRTHNDVLMPEDAQIVHVGASDGKPCLWALCDPNAGKKYRRFAIVATGMAFDEFDARYVGTFMLAQGVAHVLEPVEPA